MRTSCLSPKSCQHRLQTPVEMSGAQKKKYHEEKENPFLRLFPQPTATIKQANPAGVLVL